METTADQLVCLSVESEPNRPSITSSGGYFCTHCGREIWVSRFGVNLLSERPLIALCCDICAVHRFEDDVVVVAPTDEQMSEVEKAVGYELPSKEAILAIVRRRMFKRKDVN